MDKYCTFRKSSQRRLCGAVSVCPHPLLPNETLCVAHRDLIKRYNIVLASQMQGKLGGRNLEALRTPLSALPRHLPCA